MAKMNPEIKVKWVAALRSGGYKQVTEKLRHGGAHCCLGVLCDLYAKESGVGRWTKRQLSELAEPAHVGHRDSEMPSPEVVIWSGLNTDQMVRIDGKHDLLANHNDCGRTFAEIADAIEAQL